MKTPLLSLMMLTLLGAFVAGCGGNGVSATQLGQMTEAGMRIGGVDDERARRAGEAATRVTAARGNMPDETEITLGEGIALKSVTRYGGIHPDMDLQRYVNNVGLTVARYSDRPELPWVFIVSDHDDVTAWACPGGSVFVTAGLLQRMEDEAQLAGVLAHEIAHITQRHMVSMIQRADFFGGLTDLAAVTIDDNISRYSAAVDLGMETLFEKGFDRSMEYEADALGIELAATAGYDPTGLPRFLETMASPRTRTGGGWLTSTHPPLRDRLNRINSHLQATGLDAHQGGRAADRFSRATAVVRNR
ncbi:MAG: M48 family metalloprotease [Candidatus Sumerlaeia bacterium]|nr:M48 family metalloprotease [Candidatus Sumerlaeia bacterium]